MKLMPCTHFKSKQITHQKQHDIHTVRKSENAVPHSTVLSFGATVLWFIYKIPFVILENLGKARANKKNISSICLHLHLLPNIVFCNQHVQSACVCKLQSTCSIRSKTVIQTLNSIIKTRCTKTTGLAETDWMRGNEQITEWMSHFELIEALKRWTPCDLLNH